MVCPATAILSPTSLRSEVLLCLRRDGDLVSTKAVSRQEGFYANKMNVNEM